MRLLQLGALEALAWRHRSAYCQVLALVERFRGFLKADRAPMQKLVSITLFASLIIGAETARAITGTPPPSIVTSTSHAGLVTSRLDPTRNDRGETGTAIHSSDPLLRKGVSSYLVLTAAHGLLHDEDRPAGIEKPRFHSFQHDGTGVTIHGLGLAHPEWHGNGDQDIGILLLEDVVQIEPSRIATAAEFGSLVSGQSLDIEGGSNGIIPTSTIKKGTASFNSSGTHLFLLDPQPHHYQGGDSGGPTYLTLLGSQRRIVGVNNSVNPAGKMYAVRADVYKNWAEGNFIRSYNGPGGVDDNFTWQFDDTRWNVINLNRWDLDVTITHTGRPNGNQIDVSQTWAILNNETLIYTYEFDNSGQYTAGWPKLGYAGLGGFLRPRNPPEAGRFSDGMTYPIDFAWTPHIQWVRDPINAPGNRERGNTGFYNGSQGTLELLGAGLQTTKLDNFGGSILLTTRQGFRHRSGNSANYEERDDLMSFVPASLPDNSTTDVVFTPSLLIVESLRNTGTIFVDRYSKMWVLGDFWHQEGALSLENEVLVTGNLHLGNAQINYASATGDLLVLGKIIPLDTSTIRINIDDFSPSAPNPGWNVLSASQLDLTSNQQTQIRLRSLVDASNMPGMAANFNPVQSYSIPIVKTTGGIQNFHSDLFVVDNSEFLNDTRGGAFSIRQLGNELHLVLSPGISAIPGDYNQNGNVDAADYVIWRDMFGQTGTNLAADGNGDGMIGTADYNVWRAHFGQTAIGSGGQGDIAPAVPEANSIALLWSLVLTGNAYAIAGGSRNNFRVSRNCRMSGLEA
jgi:hypothetical protein